MTGTPTGWTRTELGSLGRYINGRGFKKTEWSDRGRPIIRIQNLTGSNESFNRFEGDVEDRYVVRPGDLLVSWAATLGAYFWTGEEGVLNQHIFKVESAIDPRFHKYLLDHKLAALMGHTHGSGMVHITRGRFDSLPVDVPPLDEQRRIVDILEDHLSRLDAAEDGLADAAIRAKSLATSTAARLVQEAAKAADARALNSVARIGTGATPRRGEARYWNDGAVPWVTSGELAQGLIHKATQKITDVAMAETSVKLWPAGTLLVAMYGEGKTRGTVGELALAATTNQACAAIVLDRPQPIHRAWLRLVLETRYDAMRREATGGVQPNLNLGHFRAMQVPWPATGAMEEAVHAVSEVREAVSAVSRGIALGRARSAGLRRALLAAAFEGRLTGHAPDLDRAEEAAG